MLGYKTTILKPYLLVRCMIHAVMSYFMTGDQCHWIILLLHCIIKKSRTVKYTMAGLAKKLKLLEFETD